MGLVLLQCVAWMASGAATIPFAFGNKPRMLLIDKCSLCMRPRVLSIVYKGGSFLKTAVILGQSWAWIQGMYNVPVYVLVVMAMHYMPRDLLFKALESIAVVAEPVMIVSEAASQALAISSMGVDAVRMHLSSRAGGDGIMYAAIICGTIAGCGGSIIANMLGVESGSWSVRTPAQLKSPTCKVIAPFVGAIVYFGLTDRMHLRAMWPKFLGAAPAFPLMGPAAAMGALMVILMSHKMMGVMEPMMKSLTTLMSSSSASRSPAKRSQSPAPRKKKMAK